MEHLRKPDLPDIEEYLRLRSQDYSLPQNKHLGPLIRFHSGPFKGRVYRRRPDGGLVRVKGLRRIGKKYRQADVEFGELKE